jgi:Flp pilus assembly protein TadD
MGLREALKGWFSRQKTAQAGRSAGPSPAADAGEAEKWCMQGAEHLAQGRLAEAEGAVNRALEKRHDYVEALLLQSAIVREQGRLEDAADYLSLAVHFRPGSGEAHYQLGVVSALQGRTEEAERHFRQAVQTEPLHAKAHNSLGALLSDRGALDEAVNCYRRAVEIRPEFAPARSNLGSLLITHFDQFEEGARHIEEAVRLAPDSPDVRSNWAMLLQYRGRFHEALGRWTELIDSGVLADDSKARVDRAMINLLLGDFGTGWDEYELRFDAARGFARDFGLPRWNGEPLAGKSILVYAEQGIGDEIMFASCLSDLIAVAGRVTVECTDRLETIFRRSFPRASVHGGRKGDPADWLVEYGPLDFQVPIGSLPRRFRRDRGAFPGVSPYLFADTVRVDHWRQRLRERGVRPAIGLSWRGGTAASRSKDRSVPPELLGQIMRRDFLCVSLQHGADDAPVALPGLCVFPGVTRDLEDLAALMGALDLVVSVQNTNVHLAGALGRPVWALLPNRPEWRYGASGESMPWYPSLKLYRRGHEESWEASLARLAKDLESRFS